MRFEQAGEAREFELACAHVRTTGAFSRGHAHLRKIAALINRDEAVGIIAERIITNDSCTASIVKGILTAMWPEGARQTASRISAAIEYFGWPLVREIASVAMLHQAHQDLVPRGGPVLALDRQALAVFSAACELGCEGYGPLFANVGTAGMYAIGGAGYQDLRKRGFRSQQELSVAERGIFGFDHGMLGAAMLNDADMPESVIMAAATHGRPGHLIWLAESVAEAESVNGGLPLVVREDSESWFGVHGIDPKKLGDLRRNLKSAAGLPEMYFESSARTLMAA